MKRITSLFILFAFIANCVMPSAVMAQALALPQPGTMVNLSPAFTPAHLKGMVIDPNNPFKFDFIIYRGDEPLSADKKQPEYTKLIKYFLAALAVPDTDQWVNLSPYEQDRIIPDDFGFTEMGRDLLAQDYILKQLASSLTNPDSELGKRFWDSVYKQAYQKYGTTEVPTDIINKVWIVPDKAVVYEKGNTVYVLENHLKVMMEKDYLAMKQSAGLSDSAPQTSDQQALTQDIMREVIIPAIEKEVNEGKNFAQLRQVYSGMLLATWYKRALKESILGKLYADQGKVKGIDQDPKANQEIYNQYVEAFKKGVFNMIKEDVDQYSQEIIPRKYFSGGLQGTGNTPFTNVGPAEGEQDYAQAEPKIDLAMTSLQSPMSERQLANAYLRANTPKSRQDVIDQTPNEMEAGLIRIAANKAMDAFTLQASLIRRGINRDAGRDKAYEVYRQEVNKYNERYGTHVAVWDPQIFSQIGLAEAYGDAAMVAPTPREILHNQQVIQGVTAIFGKEQLLLSTLRRYPLLEGATYGFFSGQKAVQDALGGVSPRVGVYIPKLGTWVGVAEVLQAVTPNSVLHMLEISGSKYPVLVSDAAMVSVREEKRAGIGDRSYVPQDLIRLVDGLSSDLERQRGSGEASVRSYNDMGYLFMRAAVENANAGIWQDNHLSDRWNGSYWHIPQADQFLAWLSRQKGILTGAEGVTPQAGDVRVIENQKRVVFSVGALVDNFDSEAVKARLDDIRKETDQTTTDGGVMIDGGYDDLKFMIMLSAQNDLSGIWKGQNDGVWRVPDVAALKTWLDQQKANIDAAMVTVREERRAVVEVDKTRGNYAPQDLAREIDRLSAELKGQAVGRESSVRSYSDMSFVLMLAASKNANAGIWQDNHLSDRWNGSYWHIPQADQFLAWLSQQKGILTGAEGVTPQAGDVRVIENQKRVVFSVGALVDNFDSEAVKARLDDIRKETDQTTTDGGVMIDGGYDDLKFMIMLSAQNDLSGIWKGQNDGVWRVPDVAALKTWLDQQKANIDAAMVAPTPREILHNQQVIQGVTAIFGKEQLLLSTLRRYPLLEGATYGFFSGQKAVQDALGGVSPRVGVYIPKRGTWVGVAEVLQAVTPNSVLHMLEIGGSKYPVLVSDAAMTTNNTMGNDRQVLQDMLGRVSPQQLAVPETTEAGVKKVAFSSENFGFEVAISEVKEGHVIDISGRQPTLSGDIRYQDWVEIPSDPEIIQEYYPNGVVDFTGFQEWTNEQILAKVKEALAADAAMVAPTPREILQNQAVINGLAPIFGKEQLLLSALRRLPEGATYRFFSGQKAVVDALGGISPRVGVFIPGRGAWVRTEEAVNAVTPNGVLHVVYIGDQKYPVLVTDAAMNFTRGGIDLNAASLDLQIKRDGNGVPLPVSQQNLDNIKIDGLVPVILNIRSAAGLPLFSELPGPSGGTNA